MKTIEIIQRDGTTHKVKLCDCHSHLVTDKVWSYLNGFAARNNDGYMHKIIYCNAHNIEMDNKILVKHINGDTMDNKCENLVGKKRSIV